MDGPAIFDKVKGCHISVAAQQLQVRGSTDSEFAVYSANKPTIEHSTGVAGLSDPANPDCLPYQMLLMPLETGSCVAACMSSAAQCAAAWRLGGCWLTAPVELQELTA